MAFGFGSILLDFYMCFPVIAVSADSGVSAPIV